MSKILTILEREYSIEYCVKKFSTPRIFPKELEKKPKSSFTNHEKKHFTRKGFRWYIYYDFLNPETGKLERQDPIYYEINRKFKDFDSRYKWIKIYRNSVENILKNGFSPFETEDNQTEFSSKSALNHVLKLKKHELKESTFGDYETRANNFLEYLKRKGLDKKSITAIDKQTVNNYLNHVLKKSSASNRNNTQTVLSALFTKLVNESLININFIKDGIPKLKSQPKKNTAFTQQQVKEIFKKAKKEDIWLYYFLAHIYYGLFRNVEVVRIKIPHINIKDKLIHSNTKTTTQFKQIPEILIEEFYSKFDFTKYPKDYFLFTKDDQPSQWLTRTDKKTGKKTVTEERNRRGYWGKRFTKNIRQPMGFSEEYTIYSLRHSAIGKIFIEKIEEYKKAKVPNFEDKALEYIRKITDHQDNKTVRNYLREIGYYKIDDWSEMLL